MVQPVESLDEVNIPRLLSGVFAAVVRLVGDLRDGADSQLPVLSGAGYFGFHRLTGIHERTSAATALLENLQLLHWIRQHWHT